MKLVTALTTSLVVASRLLALDITQFSLDFDLSLGQKDSYMAPYYTYFSKTIQQRNLTYLQPFSGSDLLRFCKKMYNQNKPSRFDTEAESLLTANPRIPRTFHQIWIGNKPFPEKYKKWQQTWQSVPGWTYRLWTNEDVEKLNLFNKDLFYKEKNFGARADILRMEILYRFGGVYIDTDFELLKPEFFTYLTHTYDFFAGLTPIDSLYHWGNFVIANGIIGSIPGHPILEDYIKNLGTIDKNAGIIAKGPGFLSKVILMHAGKQHRDIIFPPTFFYPVGNMQMHVKPYISIKHFETKLKVLKRDCCHPESAAIHWWEGSWELPDAQVRK